MAGISLLQTVESSIPVRTGSTTVAATDTGGLAIRYDDYSFRYISLRTDVVTSIPLTGGTTLFNDDSFNQLLNLEGAGTIATHTVTLPSNDNSQVGQEVVISTLAQITALTINGATTIRGYSAPFTLTAGSSKRLVKIADDTWAIV